MAKGKQVKNFDYLGSFTDADYLGAPLSEGDVIRFDVYAPNPAAVKEVGGQGNGKYDRIAISPGLQVEVWVSDDGGDFSYATTLNATGPVMFETLDEGVERQNYRGHNILGDPVDAGTPDTYFLKYTVGNFTYVGTVPDNVAVEDLNGSGRIWDILDLL